jgi:hypothetical protein
MDTLTAPITAILEALQALGYDDVSHLPRYSDDHCLDSWAEAQLDEATDDAVRLLKALQALCALIEFVRQ